jgi:hypothetical protein
MNSTRTLLADTCTRLFTDQVTPALIEAAEKGTWPAALWQQLGVSRNEGAVVFNDDAPLAGIRRALTGGKERP